MSFISTTNTGKNFDVSNAIAIFVLAFPESAAKLNAIKSNRAKAKFMNEYGEAMASKVVDDMKSHLSNAFTRFSASLAFVVKSDGGWMSPAKLERTLEEVETIREIMASKSCFKAV